MSHAGILLEIFWREQAKKELEAAQEAAKQERLAAIRIAKFPALEAALKRAHETELESASLIERSEELAGVKS